MSQTEGVKRFQGVSSPGYHILAPGSSSVERNSPSVRLKLIMDSMCRESWTKPFSTYLPVYVWVSLLRTNNQVSETKTILKHFVTSLPDLLLQKQSNKMFFNPERHKKQEGICEFSARLASLLNSSRQTYQGTASGIILFAVCPIWLRSQL